MMQITTQQARDLLRLFHTLESVPVQIINATGADALRAMFPDADQRELFAAAESAKNDFMLDPAHMTWGDVAISLPDSWFSWNWEPQTDAELTIATSATFADTVINATNGSKSVEQDWDAGITTFVFSDGSKIVWDDIGFWVQA